MTKIKVSTKIKNKIKSMLQSNKRINIPAIDKLHKAMSTKSSWYRKWHAHPNQHITQWVLLLVVTIGVVMLFTIKPQDPALVGMQSDASYDNLCSHKESEIKNLSKDLIDVGLELTKADVLAKDRINTELTQIAQDRFEKIKLNIEECGVEAALENVISTNDRSKLSTSALNFVEEKKTITGTYQRLIADNFETDTAVESFFIKDASENRKELIFAQSTVIPNAVTGARLSVPVYVFPDYNKAIVNPEENIQVLGAAAPSSANSRVAVVMFNFQNLALIPATGDQVRGHLFANNPSAKSYFNEVSGNNQSLTSHFRTDGDIYGYYTIPIDYNNDCRQGQNSTNFTNLEAWTSAANAMATNPSIPVDQRFNPNNYDLITYVFPPINCPWSGLGELGGKRSWINSVNNGVGLFAHEFGHNFSRMHASTLSCTSGAGGPAVAMSENCAISDEYGDPFNVMGRSSQRKHMSGFHKGIQYLNQQSWLTPNNVQTLSQAANADGTYTIAPLHADPASVPPGSTKVIRIPKTLNVGGNLIQGYYYLEFRQPYGLDAGGNQNFYNGVSIRHGTDFNYPNSINNSFLIDTTPSTNFADDQPLAAGQTFTDPVSNITITTQAIDSTSATVRVTIGAPACQPVRPTFTVTPDRTTGAPGATVNYTFTLRNNDLPSCVPQSTYTVAPNAQGGLPAGWIQDPPSWTQTLQAGQEASRIVRITPPANAALNVPHFIEQTAIRQGVPFVSSGWAIFHTIVIPQDTTAPTVSILNPPDGARINFYDRNPLVASVTAADNIGVVSIALYSNNVLVKTCTNTTTCDYTFSDRKKKVDYPYTFTATATDAAGNSVSRTHSYTYIINIR